MGAMTSSTDTSQPAPPLRPGTFLRAPDNRIIAGVAGGLGRRIGVDPFAIRIALVILTLAGGAGLVLYGVAWLLSRDPDAGEVVADTGFDLRQAVALGLVTLGLTLLLRRLGVWFADALVWPALFAGTVSAVVWTRAAPAATGRHRLTEPTPVRVVIAAVLAFAGMASFWVVVPDVRRVVVPLAGIVIGFGLLLMPVLARLWHNLEEERAARARQAARDEVAAHLHDSVLQTLALIQRSDDPRRARTLARTQERELRAWLYGSRPLAGASRDLEAAVDDLLADVEAGYDLAVDAVVVGAVEHVDDDPDVLALLAATREALVNAAKHSGLDTASLYVEVDEDRVTAFVRDRGRGFDPADVTNDRHGLRDSIHARLRRHGGGASVVANPGEGTEVEAWVPRNDRPTDSGTKDQP